MLRGGGVEVCLYEHIGLVKSARQRKFGQTFCGSKKDWSKLGVSIIGLPGWAGETGQTLCKGTIS